MFFRLLEPNIKVMISCCKKSCLSVGGRATHKGRQRTVGPVDSSTHPGAPVESPCVQAGPDTDAPTHLNTRTTLQLLSTCPVNPSRPTRKCPETPASPPGDPP